MIRATLLTLATACVPPCFAAPVTYEFKATNQSAFSVFEVGDTVQGRFTFDDADPPGVGEITSPSLSVLSRQEAPTANLTIVTPRRPRARRRSAASIAGRGRRPTWRSSPAASTCGSRTKTS